MINYDTPKLTLRGGVEMDIPNDWVDAWCVLYGTDYTLREIKKACIWSLDNVDRRKTKRGARRFLGSWLMRNMDEAPKKGNDLKGRYSK